MANKTEARYLNTKHAADYLGISPSTLVRLRIQGGGPLYAKAARRVIYEIADLDAWVKENKRRLTGEDKGK